MDFAKATMLKKGNNLFGIANNFNSLLVNCLSELNPSQVKFTAKNSMIKVLQ